MTRSTPAAPVRYRPGILPLTVMGALILLLGGLAGPRPVAAQTGGALSDLMQIAPGHSRAVTSSDPDLSSNFDRRTYIEPG
jgi:hypothetical protein